MTQDELSIEKLQLLLRTRAKLIAGIFSVTLAVTVVITLLTPTMYGAKVLLNFDFSGVNPIDSRSRNVLVQDTYISTQIDIAKSLNVAEKVEKSLDEYEKSRLIVALEMETTLKDRVFRSIKVFFSSLMESDDKRLPVGTMQTAIDPGVPALEISSAYSWLVPVIRNNLFVEPRFNSRIVEISYSSTDPKIAALVANRFAEAYIKTNLEMVTDPATKTTSWFNQRLSDLRKKLEGAQSALTAYQQKEGIVSTDERLDTENSRLQALSAQLTKAQIEMREAITRQQKLNDFVKSGGSVMTLDEVFGDSTVQRIKQEIRSLESEYVELSSTLGKNHPRLKQVGAELAAAKMRLKNEIDTIIDGVNNGVEISKARERDIQVALEAQKQLVLDLKHEHDRISVLNRDMESAQATYNAALTQMNASSMQSMMEQTSVSILDPAIIPRRPSSPKWSKNLVLAVLAGLILGIGVAVFMELLVRRVHSKDDLLLHFNVPLLGHLKNG